MNAKTSAFAALAAGALGFLAVRRARRRPAVHLQGAVVLITGGSRGLGLATAREFGAHGATIAICARDEEELLRAESSLNARGIRARHFVCDISDPDQVAAMVRDVTRTLGPIDILVNNAGVIRVGPFASMTVQDFEDAMKVMFWGMLHTTMAVLPSMRKQKRGSIVNITSVGGKVSVPHLLPYCCAKFAASALSEGLRTELAPEGIRVTTVVPGLMRTGSHLNAQFKGRQAEEYRWFAAGAATPLISIAAERAAKSIVSAALRGDAEKILSLPADVLARLHGLAPGLTSELLGIAQLALPSESAGTHGAIPGREIEARFTSRLWKLSTRAGQRAAESLNEIAEPAKQTSPAPI